MAHHVNKSLQNANFALKYQLLRFRRTLNALAHHISSLRKKLRRPRSLYQFVQLAPVLYFHTNFIIFQKISSFVKPKISQKFLKKVIIFSVLFFSFSIANAGWLDISIGWGGWSSGLPEPAKMGLPFEWSSEATRPVVLIIKEAIKYVGLIAILVVSWGGVQFLTSIGNDEKVKHAKQTVIYALVWVLLSVVSYTIVDIVNGLII